MKLRWRPSPSPGPNTRPTNTFELGLPPAAAVMVADEVVAQGPDISEEKVEAAIRRHLGLPELPPEAKKGSWDGFLINNPV